MIFPDQGRYIIFFPVNLISILKNNYYLHDNLKKTIKSIQQYKSNASQVPTKKCK